jgi:hypothetical protein
VTAGGWGSGGEATGGGGGAAAAAPFPSARRSARQGKRGALSDE